MAMNGDSTMWQENNKLDVARMSEHDPERHKRFSMIDAGWRVDYSGFPLTCAARDELLGLAGTGELARAVTALFSGAIVNPSENQPALHMSLRAAGPDPELAEQRERFLHLAAELHEGSQGLTDLLHVGIGGSDLGPRLVADALDAFDGRVRVHWLSTMDGRRFEQLTRRLDPARTGLVVASKSFGTEETLTLARAARDWMGAGFTDRSWASTARPDRAVEFGIAPERVLHFPAWVGGRFSLWSSVGVSAAAVIGRERFEQLLSGARQADRRFCESPDAGSLAVMLALLMHFLRRGLDLPTLGVVSYEPRLALLGDYLQQLIMESLGKGVDLRDRPVDQPTAPLIFGGRGTDLQHSIFQAFHQGPETHPLILVGSLADDHAYPEWHRAQLSHLLAQARALTRGRSDGAAFQRLPGNRPVALLLTERLTPEGLGYLLASFEHAVYALAVFWDINAFDQWGVEEGKRLAAQIRQRLDRAPVSLESLGKES
ncbi:MAG: glucose-6-phosphate isomerase [Wenzhouxiangella sp.]|nr:MAG: glucose-6-phosphate isomerase [Wenzhouxiangella sp.]